MTRRHVRRTVAAVGVVGLTGALAGLLLTGAGGPVTAQAKPAGLDRQALAKELIAHGLTRFATPAYARALAINAGEPASPGRRVGGDAASARTKVARDGAALLPRAGLVNVRVNDPHTDVHQVDQTTQSETAIAVSGSHVAVGFNDSQQMLLALTDGADLSGYAWSADGGRSFHDGGTLPNPTTFINFGDPWMASDRGGRMYYSTLTYGGQTGNLEIGVARSGDGGRTWSVPTIASPNDVSLYYTGDKDAITVGRDPVRAGQDNVYASWDDTVFAANGDFMTGLPVSTSKDHGATWSMHYADKLTIDPYGCSFSQYIGAQPLVDPRDGTLYVAAEKLSTLDPDCTGGTVSAQELVFTSHDAGVTFSHGLTVSDVVPASPTGAVELAPGQLVRTVEFPTLAFYQGRLWMAWNDGSQGRSHIRLATSSDTAKTWTTRWATSGTGDELQPALSADRAGLHLAYYQRTAQNTLDTVLADSTDGGVHLAARAVTTRPFPGVSTSPPFDPQIAGGYMGDYIANVTDGSHRYLAWGDNRDRVSNFMHPAGRNDPDVFFARTR